MAMSEILQLWDLPMPALAGLVSLGDLYAFNNLCKGF